MVYRPITRQARADASRFHYCHHQPLVITDPRVERRKCTYRHVIGDPRVSLFLLGVSYTTNRQDDHCDRWG